MAWEYNQTSGQIQRGLTLWRGYSGHGPGRNRHSHEREAGIGPIPCGQYALYLHEDAAKAAKFIMRCVPVGGTNTWNRDGFEIHGDSIEHPGEGFASHGCIILNLPPRRVVWESGDRDLTVVSGLDPQESVS